MEPEERVERRLAAIFAADVEGYSRLMRADEVGTLQTLTRHREVMDRLIAQHRGRIANTAGDSVLAEFPSVVDSLKCALDVQEAVDKTNAEISEDRRVRFRIGIHVGDVMVRGGDLFGDGVNIAARLQALAEPGGICVSGDAYQYTRRNLHLNFTDLGQQTVKNIDEDIRAYAVRGMSGLPAPDESDRPKPLPLPDKPSLAVLPFTNMSGDPEQEYFADGMVEDIITALSRFGGLFVIARNSSFTYKGRAVDVRQVGRELGVRYVLEGSLRRAGNRIRITGQLIEAQTGRHVWAERYDRELSDIFVLQDEITSSIVGAIEPSLRYAEIGRALLKPTESLGAYELYLQALSHSYLASNEGYRRAEHLLRQALERDPNYADALATLADCVARLYLIGWQSDLNQTRLDVAHYAERAVVAGPHNAYALAVSAYAYAVILGRIDEAADLANRALAINPNSAHVRMCSALAIMYDGRFNEAITHFEAAMRLSPLDPRSFTLCSGIGMCYFFLRRFDQCERWMLRGLHHRPNHPTLLRHLAAAQAHLGRLDDAKRTIDRLLAAQPNSSLTRSRQTSYRHSWMSDLHQEGLRKAGLPE